VEIDKVRPHSVLTRDGSEMNASKCKFVWIESWLYSDLWFRL